MNKDLKSLRSLYKKAKEAKTGSEIRCPSCLSMHTKKAYNTTFDSKQCKDNYWNNVTPTKRNNTTRISPANDAYMQENNIGKYREEDTDFDDDQSWDAHKDSF